MKKVCESCNSRIATIADSDQQVFEFPKKLVWNVCRKCYDAAQNSGLIKDVFYTNYTQLQKE